MRETETMIDKMQECIEECSNCHNVCADTITYCIEMGGEHVKPQHLALMLDCAEICQTSANFMLRESKRHVLTCDACAKICEQCATECERFGDDEQMQLCAEACRSCAESCREMAAMA